MPDWRFDAAVNELRAAAVHASERFRLLQARLDDLIEAEAAYLRGDDSAVERAQALLPLIEPYWGWTTPYASAISDLMMGSAVLQAALYERRPQALALRRARHARYPAYRPYQDPVNAACTACCAPIYAHTGTVYCWECAQRYDPLTCTAVEDARAAIARAWHARDAAAIIACLQAQAGYHIESDAARAIRAAVEAQDDHVHRILRLLAEWYAGRAAYAGLADPESLLRIRPIPPALATVYPLDSIVAHYAARAEALRAQREAARRRRAIERDWIRQARVETGITFVPHADIIEVGLEIECGADVTRIPQGVDRTFDGSVYVEPDPYNDNHDDWQADLELRFRFAAAEWPEWAARIRALWKLASVRQNRTCGNHVHVSLTERALDAIARPEFLRWFRARYVEDRCDEEKYVARLDNRYCRWDCPSASEIRARMRERGTHAPGSTRYRAINWHAYHDHGTVEFRVLPYAENGVEYALAVTWLLQKLSEYLQSSLEATNV